MTTLVRANIATLLVLLVLLVLPIATVHAQQLTPNAFLPAPIGANLLILSGGLSTGELSLDPSLPVKDVHANIDTIAVGYGRTLDFFGRYANFGVVVPYVHGNLDGLYLGEYQSVHRTRSARCSCTRSTPSGRACGLRWTARTTRVAARR